MFSCMARLSRFVTVVALLGGATVFLSACTGGSDPVASPSPSVSTVVTPSPSLSPSPTPLTDDELLALIPEDARGEDFLSASSFAVYFLSTYPSIVTGDDSRLFDLITDEGCIFCNNVREALSGSLQPGESLQGGEVTSLQALADGGLQPDGTWNVSFDMTVAALERVDRDGNVLLIDPGGPGRVTVILTYATHWIAMGVGAESA